MEEVNVIKGIVFCQMVLGSARIRRCKKAVEQGATVTLDGKRKVGFSGYSPDGNLSMGFAPGIDNLLLATGCAGAGISVSGGVGLTFAELAADKPNPFDFSEFEIDRFRTIDPFSETWLKKCAASRSSKLSG